MVRIYFPQTFVSNIQSNTNFGPQGPFPSGGAGPTISNEIVEETVGNFVDLNYNDGIEIGQVEIDE